MQFPISIRSITFFRYFEVPESTFFFDCLKAVESYELIMSSLQTLLIGKKILFFERNIFAILRIAFAINREI